MISKVVAIQEVARGEERIRCNFKQIMKEFSYLDGMIHKGDRVLIKPNFVAPFEYATTNRILLKCMVDLIKEKDAVPIIAESAGFEFSTEQAFKILKIDQFCRENDVELINLDEQKFVYVDSNNEKVPKYLLPQIIYEVDHIIDMPCLKGHSLTKVTFGIKNLFGLLHRETRRKIHATDLEYGISKLAELIKVDFVMVSGIWNLTNAVYSDVSYQGIIVAGNNIYDVDKVCCDIFGVSYDQIPHIAYGVSKDDFEYKKLSDIKKIIGNIEDRNEHFIKQNKKYKLIYRLDSIFSAVFKKSIIPYCHYYIALRPVINKKKCIKCGKCEAICPVQAIHKQRIIPKKCMKVRCFKCYEVCECAAIEKKGIHR